MRKSLLGFALAVGGGAAFAQGASRAAAVPERMAVEIELEENISSETLHAGQEIAFHVVRDVVGPGGTVMMAGTPVTGSGGVGIGDRDREQG